ncbi:MAG: 4Fe-4S cluster-binding domain-containing protein [Candidatus Lokiarchaeota archaeon]|nr:4Fe-4S cluster-binding domain-containing protein [Candidatus Lokiarchaeota archaeon]
MSNLRNPQYDACLHLATSYQCNLECNYCIAGIRYVSDIFTKADPINISALKKTLNNSNKIYRINFTGGEPFLTPNIVEACIELTKKHFIAFNSNLTPKKVEEFAEKINPERVLSIDASCHIKELERRNLLSRYIHNFLLCKNRGFNIRAIEVGYPPLLKESDKYIKIFLEKGIDLTFSPYLGSYKGKFYPDSYSEKELKILGLTEKDIIDWFHQYGKLCNAGYNVCIIYPDGDIRYCFFINKSLGNIYEGIKFNDKLIRCPVKLCNCPVNIYDPYLFRKAISEVGPYDAEWIQPFKNRIKEYMKNLFFERKQNYLIDNTRKLIIEKVMSNKFLRKYLFKHWI